MDLLVIALIGLAGAFVLWRFTAFLLGTFSWFLLVTIVASIAVGVPVPGSAVFAAIGLWAASQVASRLRRGQWRSRAMRGFSASFATLHAAR